ncbi:MAG: glycosyltransferase family 4 protein [Candidatus Diapherotrites archaeon]|nr:glycosyltransferase family 4 protein [Candidatus Diapherotrites archaeon]
MASPKSSVVFLSSFPPRECGIATFSKDLSESISKKFGHLIQPRVIALNESSSSIYNYPKKVVDQINALQSEDFSALARRINRKRGISVVNIQHEFGLFGGEYGAYLLEFLSNLKKDAVTTFHTVLPAPDPKRLEVVQQICAKCKAVVVMTEGAKRILVEEYHVPAEKVCVVPHGVPEIVPGKKELFKQKYRLTQKTVLLTFGLLSRGKGIEYVIRGLPRVVKEFPNTVYVVAGETHPKVRGNEGESYRNELERLARDLGVEKNVKFLNKYLSLNDLIELLQMADVYLSPSIDRNQSCSGTTSYAMAAGKASIVTRSNYNEEVFGQERGILVPVESHLVFENAMLKLLRNPQLVHELERRAFAYSRKMVWPNVANQYAAIYTDIHDFNFEFIAKLPKASYTHMHHLTDDFGIIQFANFFEPNPMSGYTADDNARALMVSVQALETVPSVKMERQTKKYLNFLEYCQTPDGWFHNIVDSNKNFLDRTGSEDSFGRSLWALGIASHANLQVSVHDKALSLFDHAFPNVMSLGSPRAKAFSLMGLSAFAQKDERVLHAMERISDSLVSQFHDVADENWNWFEESLTYANASICEAIFNSAQVLENPDYLGIATKSLDMLSKELILENTLMPVGHHGWYPKGQERAFFNQQPIEAGTMTTAYLKGHELAKKEEYKKNAKISFEWFFGRNSLNAVMVDHKSHGCYDGLSQTEINVNQGAESTLEYLLAHQALGRGALF